MTPEELARAITASEAEREFSRETVEGLALAYGRAETTWSLDAERAYLDRVRAVTGAQVQEAARRYLDRLLRAAGLRAAGTRAVSPQRAAALALVVALGWAGAGSAAAQPARQQLPGGLTVLVRENTATAVTAASLFVRMGSRWETEDDAGISHLLQQVLLKGTEKRSALEIAETAEDLGGGLGASADRTTPRSAPPRSRVTGERCSS